MDHPGISYTVDSPDALRVAGVATLTCHLVQVIEYVKRPLRKLATKIFDLSLLILGVFLKVYLSLQKGQSFSIHEVQTYSLLYNLPVGHSRNCAFLLLFARTGQSFSSVI